MRSYFKNELARAAGVSYRTFQRWLHQNQIILSEMGVMPRAQLIPARAAQWICGQYGIDEQELSPCSNHLFGGENLVGKEKCSTFAVPT